MTFGNESDALPVRERLRISSGNLQRTHCRTAFDRGERTVFRTHRSCLVQEGLVGVLGDLRIPLGMVPSVEKQAR